MALIRPDGAPIRVIAIAAMAENRVIGRGNALPWNLPEDMRWFRECTRGKTLLMGRKTFASIGRPLPHRRTVVLSRSRAPIAGATVVRGLGELAAEVEGAHELWVCGGAEIYALTLPRWDELLLTRVKCKIEGGDAFFPTFENAFELAEVIRDTPALRIERHVPIEAA
jgi:dihydrofolate reductase